MTATNHTLTGALIATSLASVPLLGLSLAFASHFLLDFFPHFGEQNGSFKHTSREFTLILIGDGLLLCTVLITIILINPAHLWLIVLGGLLAASPDLMWLPHYLNDIRDQPRRPYNLIERFHSSIQHEFVWGVLTELVWLAAIASLLYSRLLR